MFLQLDPHYSKDNLDESFGSKKMYLVIIEMIFFGTKLLFLAVFLSLQLLRVAHLGTGRRILYKYRRQVNNLCSAEFPGFSYE